MNGSCCWQPCPQGGYYVVAFKPVCVNHLEDVLFAELMARDGRPGSVMVPVGLVTSAPKDDAA